MAIDLTGKVCLITGTDEGVGQGLARGFLQRGARVAAGVLRKDARAIRRDNLLQVELDVTDPDQVRDSLNQVMDRFGQLDVLINNAGIYPRCAADQLDFERWRAVMDVNLDGVWRVSQAAIRHLKKSRPGGVIINVGSIALRLGMPELCHYLASKAGVVGLTRGMARDLGKFGIRVNCVHLGAIRTNGERQIIPDSKNLSAEMKAKQSLKGRLTPASVEPVFAFLASEESGDVTGQSLTVDRGWSHD
jgi:NAD(P)-dependent dehydrogenase (short-subunit alcohol dehydrogenase family)